LAAKAGRGVVFLYDEAHTLCDQPRQHQYPLGALLGAFCPSADQLTLRVAADLGGERFEIAKLAAQFQNRDANATQQSVNRLLKSNHVYRVSQGSYAYTAPLFGDFVRRAYPRQGADR